MSNVPTPAESNEPAIHDEPTAQHDPAAQHEPTAQHEPAESTPAEIVYASTADVAPEASDPVVESVIETEVTSDTATVRRAPRYGRFMTIGAALGAVVALVLTLSFSPNPEMLEQQLGFDSGQVFGFTLLIFGAIGLGLGALVALAFDRSLAKRAASVAVEHEAAHRVDETP